MAFVETAKWMRESIAGVCVEAGMEVSTGAMALAVSGLADGGTLGALSVVKSGADALLRDRDSNHKLLALAHQAQWRTVMRLCEETRAALDAQDNSPLLDKVYDIARDQAKTTPGQNLDPVDVDQPKKQTIRERIMQAFGKLPADPPSPANQLFLQHFDVFLQREIENQAQADSISGQELFNAVAAACTQAVLDDIDAIARTFNHRDMSEAGLPALVARMWDPRIGFGPTFRFILKGLLEDPKQDGQAKRILLSFAAETLGEVFRLRDLVQGLDDRLDTISTVIDKSDAALTRLLRIAMPPLPLDPDGSAGRVQADQTQYERFLDLVFTQRATTFTGREAAMADLDAMLRDDRPVLWWQISGKGGQGKSRLALELIRVAEDDGWHAGFLRKMDLADVDWANIAIDRPTLIVIDYIADPAKAAQAAMAVQKIKRRHDNTPKVRFLFVERAPFTGADGAKALWFDGFVGSGKPEILSDRYCYDPARALDLADLSAEAMTDIGNSWRAFRQKEAFTDDQQAAHLRLLTRDGEDDEAKRRAWRPLFAMLFAEYVDQDPSMALAQATRLALEEEQKECWGAADQYPDEAAWNLAALATMAGPLPLDHPVLERDDLTFYQPTTPSVIIKAWKALGFHYQSEGGASAAPILIAREPDLLGEKMLEFAFGISDGAEPFPPVCARAQTVMEDAWRVAPGPVLEFLIRLYEDKADLAMTRLYRILADVPPPDLDWLTAPGRPPDDPVPSVGDHAWRLLLASYYGLTPIAASTLWAFPVAARVVMGHGAFPLIWAAQNGHGAIVGMLLEAGADAAQVNDQSGTFPLLQASQQGHAAIVEMLLEAGAEAAQVNEQDGLFPLLQASQNGHAAIVELLLEAGADANQVNDQSGAFPLLQASQEGHTAIVGMLLDAGADAGQVNDQDGNFPLLQTSQNGHAAIVGMLLAAGADANQADKQDGIFPLLQASQQGHAAIVEMLLDAGADANQVNDQSGTFPLLMASQNGHGAIVGMLLEAGADASQVNDQSGNFPLLMVSQNGHAAIVGMLLDAGADAGQVNDQSGTFPLMLAAANGHKVVVRRLVAAGANIQQVWPKYNLNSLELCLAMYTEAMSAGNNDEARMYRRGAQVLLELGARLQDGTVPNLDDLPPDE